MVNREILSLAWFSASYVTWFANDALIVFTVPRSDSMRSVTVFRSSCGGLVDRDYQADKSQRLVDRDSHGRPRSNQVRCDLHDPSTRGFLALDKSRYQLLFINQSVAGPQALTVLGQSSIIHHDWSIINNG